MCIPSKILSPFLMRGTRWLRGIGHWGRDKGRPTMTARGDSQSCLAASSQQPQAPGSDTAGGCPFTQPPPVTGRCCQTQSSNIAVLLTHPRAHAAIAAPGLPRPPACLTAAGPGDCFSASLRRTLTTDTGPPWRTPDLAPHPRARILLPPGHRADRANEPTTAVPAATADRCFLIAT